MKVFLFYDRHFYHLSYIYMYVRVAAKTISQRCSCLWKTNEPNHTILRHIWNIRDSASHIINYENRWKNSCVSPCADIFRATMTQTFESLSHQNFTLTTQHPVQWNILLLDNLEIFFPFVLGNPYCASSYNTKWTFCCFLQLKNLWLLSCSYQFNVIYHWYGLVREFDFWKISRDFPHELGQLKSNLVINFCIDNGNISLMHCCMDFELLRGKSVFDSFS